MYDGEWINHSNDFKRCLHITEESNLMYLNSLTERLSVGNNSCPLSLTFSLNICFNLEQLLIGDYCFSNVNQFSLDGLDCLQSIVIGSNSFTSKINGYGYNKYRSFHVKNCANLKVLTIGQYSFSDFGGKFDIESKQFFFS